MPARRTPTACERSSHTKTALLYLLTFIVTPRSRNSDSGNQQTMNNNGGGNNFSGMSFGGMNQCRRSFFDKRSELHASVQASIEEMTLAKRSPRGTRDGNRWDGRRGGDRWSRRPRGRADGGYGSSNISTSQVIHNSATQSYNQGVVAGTGLVCRREMHELELERRELKAGIEALELLGGVHKRSMDPLATLLATRDLGRAALSIGPSQSDDSASFAKRAVISAELSAHAQDLGFL